MYYGYDYAIGDVSQVVLIDAQTDEEVLIAEVEIEDIRFDTCTRTFTLDCKGVNKDDENK